MRHSYKFSLWLSAFLMLAGASCKKDYLQRDPLDSVSTGIFWQTETDVNTALAGVYARLQQNFFGYQRPYLEGLSDNAYADPANSFLANIPLLTTGAITPASGIINNFFSTPYRMIASANYFLNNVDKAPLTDAKKAAFKAEVRFLRAFAYFDLVQTFGGVPLYDKFFTTVESSKIAKSTKEQVYDFINADLDFAIANLPDAAYNGRVVKGSAQAMKGRVLLTQQRFADAVTVLQQLINGAAGKFGLSPDYAAIFKTSGQNNNAVKAEILFSTQYLAPNIHQNLNGMDLEFGNYSLLQPYKDLIDEYETRSGKMITDPTSGFDPANPYANRDPRLDLTVKLPGEVWRNPTTGAVQNPANASSTTFIMEKYVDLSRAPFVPSTTANQSDQDVVHLRWADVLLMFAEAKNEVSGPDASVYDAIDLVRQRPGIAMPKVDRTVYNTQTRLRDFIRHERRVELALEGQRYFDLKRWNLAHVKLPTMKTPPGTPFVFEQKHYLFPFPQAELDNNPQLVQNEGYK